MIETKFKWQGCVCVDAFAVNHIEQKHNSRKHSLGDIDETMRSRT
jgi:hypothetical protein